MTMMATMTKPASKEPIAMYMTGIEESTYTRYPETRNSAD